MHKVKVPRVKLSNDAEIPMVGLGTWKTDASVLKQAVKDAIDIGYRHFDCALMYENEDIIGEAFKEKFEEGVISRQDIWITSKVWNTFHSRGKVLDCIKLSLSKLKTEYLDMCLIHWPMGYQEGGDLIPKNDQGKILYSDVDYVDTWKGLEDCCREGLCRNIGLSNFNFRQIQRVLEAADIKPVVLQIECHPYLNQEKLLQFCKSKNIAVTAYSCLGSPARPWVTSTDPVVLQDPLIVELAGKYSKTPAQICLRYQIQRGVIVIPKSSSRSRIESNFQIFDFELTDEDMSAINGLNRKFRAVMLEWIQDHVHYPFNDPF